MSERPARVIDPVCGMQVDVAQAEALGRVADQDGRRFAFCRAACRDVFVADPSAYVVPVSDPVPHAHAGVPVGVDHAASAPTTASPSPGTGALPVIDEGMRRWYEACPCCLGDTFPEIRAALDAERAAGGQEPAGPGICEIEDAVVPGSVAPGAGPEPSGTSTSV